MLLMRFLYGTNTQDELKEDEIKSTLPFRLNKSFICG